MPIDLSFLVLGLYYFLRLLSWLIIARVIISWVSPDSRNPVVLFIVDATEVIIAPIRNALPRGQGAMAMMDWSPLLALILVDVARYVLVGMVN